MRRGNVVRPRPEKTARALLTIAVAVGLFGAARASCGDDPLPTSSCDPAPQGFTVQAPPEVIVPSGAPGALPLCIGGQPAWGACSNNHKPCTTYLQCKVGQTYGMCEPTPFVDIRCFSRQGTEPDDTCRLERAAAWVPAAESPSVLWIPSGVLLSISRQGAAACGDTSDPWGVHLRSDTIVTGGGTLKWRFSQPASATEDCVANPTAEACLAGAFFRIASASRVAVTGMWLDANADGLKCPQRLYVCNRGQNGNCVNPTPCEHFHAIDVDGSTDVTISGNHMINLIGDGVYGSGGRVLVQNNEFTTSSANDCPGPDPLHQPNVCRNRTGVGMLGNDLTIAGNTFTGMGRTGMPGAIDVETDAGSTPPPVERIAITGNHITGWTGCEKTSGISISNHVSTPYHDILIDDNDISGCHQIGIIVWGNGDPLHLARVTNNDIAITRPLGTSYWGMYIKGSVIPGNPTQYLPAFAYVADNVISSSASTAAAELSDGIWIEASAAAVFRNRILGPWTWGVTTTSEYGTSGVSYTGASDFCGNLFCGNGNADASSCALRALSNGHQVTSNHVEYAWRGGICVGSGNASLNFQDNALDHLFQVGGSAPCIDCATPASGCDYFASNTCDATLTDCTSCF